MRALRDGRWFWWVVLACAAAIAGDVAGFGPFAESDRPHEVEVLGDSVEREPLTTTTITTTTTTSAPSTSVDVPAGDGLEVLEGLDQESLDAIQELRDLGLENLSTTTTLRD